MLHTLRDISILIIGIWVLLLGLIPLAAFYFGVRGMMALRKWLKPKAKLVQGYAVKGRNLVSTGADKAAQAVIVPTVALTEAGTMAEAAGERLQRNSKAVADRTHDARHTVMQGLRTALAQLLNGVIYVGGVIAMLNPRSTPSAIRYKEND